MHYKKLHLVIVNLYQLKKKKQNLGSYVDAERTLSILKRLPHGLLTKSLC